MSPNFENAFRREAGPGLEMRLFRPADAEPVFELTEANREYLREWLPWVDRTHTAADVREFITRTVLPQWRDRLGPQCGIWVNGAMAGGIGCHPIDWQNRSCSLGYWIASRYVGRGVVTRCVRSLLAYLFGELDLHRVVIQCGTENHRSCAIPQRLGFTKEGVLRQAQWVSGRWIDLNVWSLLRSEWTA